MAESVPTVPSKSSKTANATEGNTEATANARDAFDALAGTDAERPDPEADTAADDAAARKEAARVRDVQRASAVARGVDPDIADADKDGDADAFDPDVPDDAPVPATRATHNDAMDGLSAGSALMRATSAAGSVTCPQCGNNWPLQNRFAGGIIPCVCGKNIEVGPPRS